MKQQRLWLVKYGEVVQFQHGKSDKGIPTKQQQGTQCWCLPHLSCVRQSTEQEPWRVPSIKPRLLSLLINAWYLQRFGLLVHDAVWYFSFRWVILKLRGWSHKSILELRFFSQPPGRCNRPVAYANYFDAHVLISFGGTTHGAEKSEQLEVGTTTLKGFQYGNQYSAHICTTHGNRVRVQLRGVQNSQKVKQWSHKGNSSSIVLIRLILVDDSLMPNSGVPWDVTKSSCHSFRKAPRSHSLPKCLTLPILAQIRPSWE